MTTFGGRATAMRGGVAWALAASALAIAACGSSDDGGATAASDAATGAEAEVRAAHTKTIDSIYRKDYATTCAMITAGHRKRTFGKRNCEKGLAEIFGPRGAQGIKPEIFAIKVQGDKAQIKTRPPGVNRSPYYQTWVKTSDGWKLDHSTGKGTRTPQR